MGSILAQRHVFISYSHADQDFANRIAADLQRAGIKIWIDHAGLTPSTPNWDKAIREAIAACFAFALVATPNSCSSQVVHGEVSVARQRNCLIYPLWANGDDWAECVPLELMKTQAIDCRGTKYENGIAILISTLQHIESTLGSEIEGHQRYPRQNATFLSLSTVQQEFLRTFNIHVGKEAIDKRFAIVEHGYGRDLVYGRIRFPLMVSDDDLLVLARLGLLRVYADPPGVVFTSEAKL